MERPTDSGDVNKKPPAEKPAKKPAAAVDPANEPNNEPLPPSTPPGEFDLAIRRVTSMTREAFGSSRGAVTATYQAIGNRRPPG